MCSYLWVDPTIFCIVFINLEVQFSWSDRDSSRCNHSWCHKARFCTDIYRTCTKQISQYPHTLSGHTVVKCDEHQCRLTPAHLSDQHRDHDHQLEAHCHPLSHWTAFVVVAHVMLPNEHGTPHVLEELHPQGHRVQEQLLVLLLDGLNQEDCVQNVFSVWHHPPMHPVSKMHSICR